MGYRHFCAAACLLAGLSAPAAAQTLQQSVDSALATNPRAKQEAATLAAVSEELPQARAARLPSVTAEASASAAQRFAELPVTGEIDEFFSPLSARLEAVQPLYAGGRLRLGVERARQRRENAEAQLDDVRQQIVLEAAAAFHDVLLAEDRIEVLEEVLSLLGDQAGVAERRLELSEGDRVDVAEAKARLARARADLFAAQSAYEEVKIGYQAVTGLEASNLTATSEPLNVPDSLRAALDEARRRSPAIEAAQAALRVAETDVRLARRAHGPDVRLRASASADQDPSPAIEENFDLRASLSVTVPLYSGGQAASGRREAIALRSAAAEGVRAARTEVDRQVAGVWTRLETAIAEETALEDSVSASEEALQGMLTAQEVGVGSLTEVLDAAERLANGRLNLAVRRRQLDLVKTELAILTGRLQY